MKSNFILPERQLGEGDRQNGGGGGVLRNRPLHRAFGTVPLPKAAP